MATSHCPLPAGGSYKATAPSSLPAPRAGTVPVVAVAPSAAPMSDGLFEATFWAAFPGDGNITMIVRAAVPNGVGGANELPQPQLEASSSVGGTCTQASSQIFKGVDIGGANWKGIDYRTIDLSGAKAQPGGEAAVLTQCAAACCAWEGCGAWVAQSDTGPSKNDHNCTAKTTACCWLKPNPHGGHITNPKSTAGVVTASPARPVLPPPPPPPAPGPKSPSNTSGYHVVLVGAAKTLVVERCATAAGGEGQLQQLGSFDLSTLENGLVLEAWNILRVLVQTSTSPAGNSDDGDRGGNASGAVVTISVWFNPMFPETGFVGNASDAFRTPKPLPPRLVVTDPQPRPPGELVLTAGLRDSMVDYVSALPTSVVVV